MGHKEYCIVSGVFFSMVAVAHLLRIAYGMSIQVDEFVVPMFMSWFGMCVPAALAIWAFRTGRDSNTA